MRTVEHFLRGIIVSWRRIPRWRGKPEADKEDDLMHSFKTAIQTIMILAMENDEEITRNRLEILTLSLLHDVSEACIGCDVIFPIKNDPRLRGIIDKIEAEEFDRRFSELPPSAAKFLKEVNRFQGNEGLMIGRFFKAIEILGYASFALAEITAKKSSENDAQFMDVLKLKHDKFLELINEFPSFGTFYNPFIPLIESLGMAEISGWNVEIPLRRLIASWESLCAWPGLPSYETVLERTMKTAMLASILIPIEIEKRRRKKAEERLDFFIVLVAALIHNFAKSTAGVLSDQLKTNPTFNREVAREIEREYFLKIINEFPEPVKKMMIRAFDLEHDRESTEGRFFDAIKVLSYATFALYEYEGGGGQDYRDVLANCLPKLLQYNGEFKSFDMFFNPIKHRIEGIVEGKSRIWAEVK